MEIVERMEFNGIGINEEKISETNVGINPEINAGMFVNVPIMYVDNEVSQVHSLETENLARLTPDGQSRERTKANVQRSQSGPKSQGRPRQARKTKITVGLLGKKHGHGEKREEGGDRKCSKRDTKNKTSLTVEANTQPC